MRSEIHYLEKIRQLDMRIKGSSELHVPKQDVLGGNESINSAYVCNICPLSWNMIDHGVAGILSCFKNLIRAWCTVGETAFIHVCAL